ncbi:MAG: GerW family sporulation protein [Evtepia gabavorous]
MEKNHLSVNSWRRPLRRSKGRGRQHRGGEPIVAGEITLIPVSKISLGFGTGGSEMGGKTPKVMGENPFGGGGGAGLKVTPVCFLVINAGMVKVLPVDTSHETSLDRVVDLIPDVVNWIAGLVEEKKAKKPASEEPDGPAGNP